MEAKAKVRDIVGAEAFTGAVARALNDGRAKGVRVGVLKAAMRDVGDEVLASVLREEPGSVAVGRFGDGSHAALLAPATEQDVNEYAFRVADEVSRRARAAGLGQVQTITAGFIARGGWTSATEVLDGADVALKVTKYMAAKSGVGPPRPSA